MSGTRASGLNRTIIKYIAIMAMVSDHFAMLFIDQQQNFLLYDLMRGFGRFTAPIMCFFLVEGFFHTHSLHRYLMRLGIFAVISQPCFVLASDGGFDPIALVTHGSMIYTLFVCLLILTILAKVPAGIVQDLLVIGLVLATVTSDWGIFAPAMVLVFYLFRKEPKRMYMAYGLVGALLVAFSVGGNMLAGGAWYQEIWEAGIFAVIPMLKRYNGQAGSSRVFNKWFFYIFYPAHLLALSLIHMHTGTLM